MFPLQLWQDLEGKLSLLSEQFVASPRFEWSGCMVIATLPVI